MLPGGERRRRDRRLCRRGFGDGGQDGIRKSYGWGEEEGPATERQLVLAIAMRIMNAKKMLSVGYNCAPAAAIGSI
jgi:hypothetical protein